MDWPTALVLIAAIAASPVNLWLLTRQKPGDETPMVGASAIGYQSYPAELWPDEDDEVPFGFAGCGRE